VKAGRFFICVLVFGSFGAACGRTGSTAQRRDNTGGDSEQGAAYSRAGGSSVSSKGGAPTPGGAGAPSLGGTGEVGEGGEAGEAPCPPHSLGVEGCECGATWIHVVNEGEEDRAVAIAVDSDGNVVVVGQPRAWARKYDAGGAEIWSQAFVSSSPDGVLGVAADREGNTLVTGSVAGAGWVGKYASDGAELWTVAGPLSDGVAADTDGNVVLTGPALGATKYNPDGEELWSSPSSAVLFDSWTSAIGTDSARNVVVVGSVRQDDDPLGAENWRTDIWVRKLDPEGDELWRRTYDGGRDDWGYSVTIDSRDNVIVAGRSYLKTQAGSLSYLGWLRKYDPAGEELWTRIEEGPSGASGGAPLVGTRQMGLALGDSDDILVAWKEPHRYDDQGTLKEAWSCPASLLAVDSHGNLLLAGSVTRPNLDDTFVEQVDVWIGSYTP
jgi:hypothetical protein